MLSQQLAGFFLATERVHNCCNQANRLYSPRLARIPELNRQRSIFGLGVPMDQMPLEAHGHATDPHAGMKISSAHGSHDRHAGHSVAMFRDKFWLSFALTIPVVFWSTDVQHWLGYTAPSFPGSNLIAPILGTV